MNVMAIGILRDSGTPRRCAIDSPPGMPVEMLSVDGLAAAYMPAATREPPTIPVLLDYARLVAALHRRQAILPARYGCWFGSKAELERSLRTRRAALAEALDGVEGCDEMSVWLRPPDDPPPREGATATAEENDRSTGPERPGSAYLLGRSARYAEQDARRARDAATIARLRGALDGTYVDCREMKTTPGLPGLLSIAFLVRRSEMGRFRGAVEALGRGAAGEGLRLTGPWPPYHFSELQLRDCTP